MGRRSRCVVVLGTGRSGTSATAGMLHALGVPMGTAFVAADRNNPYGTFEDGWLMAVVRRVRAGKEPVTVLREFFAYRAKAPLWGFKIPLFVELAHEGLPLLQEVAEVRLVVADRAREATVASYRRAYGADQARAAAWFDRRYGAMLRLLVAWEGSALDLLWRETLADPLQAATRLAAFAFEGMGFPDLATVRKAAGHIR